MPLTAVNMNVHYRQDQSVPENINVENRTIKDIIFSTGQRGLRYDFWSGETYYEELEISENAIRGERLDKGLSIIDSHRSWGGIDAVFGITERWEVKDGQIVGDARFSDDDESDKNFKKVQSRILRHVSLGYKTHRMKYVGDAEDGIPIYRAVDWEPTELSFVPVSFETNNGTRSESGESKTDAYRCEIETEDSNMKIPFTRMTRGGYMTPDNGPEGTPGGGAPAEPEQRQEPTKPAAPAEPEQRQEPTKPAPSEPAPTRADLASEMQEFLTIGERCGIERSEVMAQYGRGISLDDFRKYALDEMGERSQGQNPARPKGSQEDQQEKVRDLATDYLMHRGGSVEVNQERVALANKKFQGMRLLDLVRHFTGAGFGQSSHKIASRAFQSTSDFSLILENVMHKTLQAGYSETERTFVGIPQVKSASDFRAQNVYRLGDAPDLRRLNENGEYKSGTFGSEKETFIMDTFARKINVTRQTLINDDMDALSMLPYMFGQAGSRLESDLFWGMVLNYDFEKQTTANFTMVDGNHLFHSDHSNVLTGATSALSKTSLSNMRKLGRKQKTVDKKLMNVQYNTFVFPEDLETTAEDLLVNTLYPNTPENINSFRGKHEMRIEPRLGQVSAKAWYGFSDIIKSFVISYLDGEQGMFSDVINSNDIDGMTVLARKDFGVGMIDWRGAARSAGE